LRVRIPARENDEFVIVTVGAIEAWCDVTIGSDIRRGNMAVGHTGMGATYPGPMEVKRPRAVRGYDASCFG
jgi:hypothetical protein